MTPELPLHFNGQCVMTLQVSIKDLCVVLAHTMARTQRNLHNGTYTMARTRWHAHDGTHMTTRAQKESNLRTVELVHGVKIETVHAGHELLRRAVVVREHAQYVRIAAPVELGLEACIR